MGSTVAGLALVYSMYFTQNLTFLTRAHSDSQMNMNSVERVLEYCNIVQEKYYPDNEHDEKDESSDEKFKNIENNGDDYDVESKSLPLSTTSLITDNCENQSQSHQFTPIKQGNSTSNHISTPLPHTSLSQLSSPLTPSYHTPLSSPFNSNTTHKINTSISTTTTTKHTTMKTTLTKTPTKTTKTPTKIYKSPLSLVSTVTPLSVHPRSTVQLVPENWPDRGEVVFDCLSMRYRDNTPSVLRYVHIFIFSLL